MGFRGHSTKPQLTFFAGPDSVQVQSPPLNEELAAKGQTA
jgi:hypothetical protein